MEPRLYETWSGGLLGNYFEL